MDEADTNKMIRTAYFMFACSRNLSIYKTELSKRIIQVNGKSEKKFQCRGDFELLGQLMLETKVVLYVLRSEHFKPT